MSNTHTEQHAHPHGRGRWWLGLSRWFARHKRAVTVLSAFSVLAGFIIQDALEEEVKDKLSAIVLALQGQDLAQEGIGATTALQDIRGQLGLVKMKLIDEKPITDSDRQLAQLQLNRVDAIAMVGGNIAALHSQMTALPDDFRKTEADFEARYMALFVESGSNGNQESIDALTKYAPRWEAISDESRHLTGDGIQRLQNLQKKSEQRYNLYQVLSYVSFFLGWAVGLLSGLATGKAEAAVGG